MLDANLKTQLKAYLERVTQPIELVASLDDRPASQEMRELLQDIAGLSRQDQPAPGRPGRAPAVVLDQPRRPRHGRALCRHPDGPRIHLAGAGAAAGRRPPAQGGRRRHRADPGRSTGDFVFETYMSLTCHNCPDVVQALNLMAVLNPRVRHVAIDGGAVQGRGRRAPDHGRAHGLPERPGVRLRPHGTGRDPGQGRHRRGRARRRQAGRQGAVRRADRRRRPGRRRGGGVCRAQGHPHRHRGRTLRRPDAGHAGASRTSSRCRRPTARSSPPRWKRMCAPTTWTS